ncbi:DUF3891 family protein [Dyadobacter bucti]|uniref:DUF3891 family protein n=1 Tax=Dyadobacter bucti TaxID=2572203 RepID=UPI00110893B7|nr:DUF3891 family protein [Dyadobacter bucti]
MIVNYTENGWSIITQQSHGLLAAQICGRWKKDRQPQRWIETLIATAEHDDGKDELARPELIHKNGGPKNFKMEPFDKGYCEQLLNKAMAKGRYIGILVSMHIRFLYGADPHAKAYCSSLAKQEQSWIKQANTTTGQVKASYELLEFCDAFSLLICQQLAQPEGRSMEISNGPDGTAYQLSMSDDGHLIVSPWPFEEKSFAVNYESRTIPELTFKSSDAFRRKFEKTVPVGHQLIICEEH